MKRFFKHGIQQNYLIIIAITSVLLFIGGASYALFTMHIEYGNTLGIKTGTLTGELKVDGTVSSQITVNQKETKEFTVTLKNNNNRTARYLLYYIGTLPSGVEVGYMTDGSVPPEANGRNIASEVTETYIIKVKNTTTSSQTIQLKLDSGLEHIDLALPENGHLFEEMNPEPMTVEQFLVNYTNEENTEFNDHTKDKMFVFHHEAGAQQAGWTKEELTDYRYIGEDPNNYVTFNGEEAGWRIIGVFTVENESGEKEKRVKLIHNAGIGEVTWDTGNENDWPNASLMKVINPDTGSTTFSWTEEGKQMIGDTKWYLGGRSNSKVISSQYYKDERGTETCQTTGNCDTDRQPYWIGKVGLMYPSDYGYATSDPTCLASETLREYDQESCSSNDWIFKSLNPTSNSVNQWTLFPYSYHSYGAFYVHSTGCVDNSNVTNTLAVRPVVYLLSSIQYIQGNGSKDEPFVFTR